MVARSLTALMLGAALATLPPAAHAKPQMPDEEPAAPQKAATPKAKPAAPDGAARRTKPKSSEPASRARPQTAAGPAGASAIGHTATKGIGLALGEPTGLLFKVWFEPMLAIRLLAGASLMYRGFLGEADLLFYFRDLAPTARPFEFGLHLGGGVGVGAWAHRVRRQPTTDLVMLTRVIFGPNLLFREIPLEVFVDLSGGIRLVPDPTPIPGVSLGALYCF
ncbi:MAG: hypothetical protein HY903_12015 [Deltaproteobacteria bacterium]|nr:hypothetical protein [Deltaproteobacteria bacterium]